MSRHSSFNIQHLVDLSSMKKSHSSFTSRQLLECHVLESRQCQDTSRVRSIVKRPHPDRGKLLFINKISVQVTASQILFKLAFVTLWSALIIEESEGELSFVCFTIRALFLLLLQTFLCSGWTYFELGEYLHLNFIYNGNTERFKYLWLHFSQNRVYLSL